jgi:hypothetical protein
VGIDAVAAIGLALPAGSRVRRMIYPAVTADGEHAAGSRSAAPLMAGWTVLLAWSGPRPGKPPPGAAAHQRAGDRGPDRC